MSFLFALVDLEKRFMDLYLRRQSRKRGIPFGLSALRELAAKLVSESRHVGG
ncbi:hypothetical protein O206_00015 [Ochrobactrum sp. EGD-AQ16]|nr:hypothetical protein O206_00015 [Ochrobactrum sp. EGD-AQ16]